VNITLAGIEYVGTTMIANRLRVLVELARNPH
jgi:hypothetical protein